AVYSTSEEEEALNERFLKINCKYITHGKGIVGGVLLVTLNNIMFDPHKTDALVLENGCKEYGIMCPLEEVTSASLFHDIVNPQLKMNFSVNKHCPDTSRDKLPSGHVQRQLSSGANSRPETNSCLNTSGAKLSKEKHRLDTSGAKLTGAKHCLDMSRDKLLSGHKYCLDTIGDKHHPDTIGDKHCPDTIRAKMSRRTLLRYIWRQTPVRTRPETNSHLNINTACTLPETNTTQKSIIYAFAPLYEHVISGAAFHTFTRLLFTCECLFAGFAGKRIRGPIMFLCLRVCKPMIKTFVSHIDAVMQQYAQRDTEPEYWFAVPQERCDHLLAFFVHWTPEAYSLEGSEAGRNGGFVLLEKAKELEIIDDYFKDREWEIVTTNESKRRGNIAVASMDVGPDANKPTLKGDSAILEPEHIEKQLTVELPPRTVGYPWTLLYSTSEHGMSLKTLYRTMSNTDAPVLLVIKDTDKQVFGALASDPFKVSDHFFGTGETFLFAFNPAFKSYKWTGENMFFIKGDMDSLAIGGGSGQFGLWLDEDLYHGRSHFCKTFNNDTLSKKEDFFIQELECWVFE
uniref:Oxidation resistance 1b n=1 Tax=Eptatretus burgeri TaxID=7764 RepID=A0A8C4X1Z0_EPTBU